MKICIVSSSGGHLSEARVLSTVYEKYEHFYILNYKIPLTDEMIDKTHFITHSERDFKLFINFIESFIILRCEKPDVILSTGAGLAVPISLVGRYLFNCTIIFIETMAAVEKPSLTGKLMYKFAHHFFYQWPSLSKFYPKAEYVGPLV